MGRILRSIRVAMARRRFLRAVKKANDGKYDKGAPVCGICGEIVIEDGTEGN